MNETVRLIDGTGVRKTQDQREERRDDTERKVTKLSEELYYYQKVAHHRNHKACSCLGLNSMNTMERLEVFTAHFATLKLHYYHHYLTCS